MPIISFGPRHVADSETSISMGTYNSRRTVTFQLQAFRSDMKARSTIWSSLLVLASSLRGSAWHAVPDAKTRNRRYQSFDIAEAETARNADIEEKEPKSDSDSHSHSDASKRAVTFLVVSLS